MQDEDDVPDILKQTALNFQENDLEYDGDEEKAWERLLSLECAD